MRDTDKVQGGLMVQYFDLAFFVALLLEIYFADALTYNMSLVFKKGLT